MKRFVLLTTTCLALAACGKAENGSYSSTPSSERSEADVAPGVNVTAAPGVAFAYRYAFRLPSTKIAEAQEKHASACEALGIAKCRITGMRYRVLGENDTQGSLSFKLDPTLARAFGKQGIEAITAAAGKLVDAEITGTDAGADIAKIQTLKAQADAELKRLDTQLARTDLKPAERTELQTQRADLVARINAAKSDTSDKQESLANTPMTFDYESGAAVQGFDASAPITSAGNVFIGSVTVTIGFVLTALAALTPPGLVVLLGWLIWRRVRPRKSAPAPPA
ncbi:MAG: hypothetical protein V4459_13875 [Pseudomonadota bacterium]